MENKCLLGLIFLSCINRCIAQSIQTINDCTCRTSDGNFYSLWPFRGTEKPRFDVPGKKYPGWRYAYNPCTSMTFGQDDPHPGKICHDIGICKYPKIEKPRDYLQVGVQTGVRCEINEGQIGLSYKTDDQSIDPPRSTVQLICDQTISFPVFEPKDEDRYIFSIKTKCACPNQCWPVITTTTGSTKVIPTTTGSTKIITTTPGPTKVIPTSTSNSTVHSPEDSKSFNWELCILVPGLAGFFIMLCSLCLWRHFAAVREALRCRCCHHGECEPLIRIHKNDLGKTEKTYRIKNKQGDKAVEHKDFGGKDKMVEPVQEEDVGDKSQTVGKNNVLSLIL